MTPAPTFAAYPLVAPPVYSRWLAGGAALLALVGSASALLRPFIEVRLAAIGMVAVLLFWVLALLLRVLYYRFNRHNAHCYGETARRIQQRWWQRHRQQAALVEAVLLGGACRTSEQMQGLFKPGHVPPVPRKTTGGVAIRLPEVSGRDSAKREHQLATLLALHWQAQREVPIVLQPLRCYWQGTPAAWRAFVEQMTKSCPQVLLPEDPEPWQGLASLDAIIDRLQGAPADARILCAGCQSSPTQPDSRLPAGEAALLWLLGPQGGVRFCRGEWFAADTDSLASVAGRAQRQSELEAPVHTCVGFSQPDISDLSAIGWNTRQHLQDANFGALAGLEAMVVLTLAASYVEAHGVPCAWLANDPDHTLALGVVEPDESTTRR
ncbi:hypothetical protein [Pseudomonas gingeri]|uniref:hypothetical protein n=1 Tax=Pseudomonas gingeri TaxID=117681 RepID=UPI0015A3B1AC|nr:hypothetical protein [Pseudomonas gingeri]NWA04999.1 hypothetical protein [Pseudomonas gingeri]NWA17167.1 hypothetical protein [Pseudomonas gingeri]NWA59092.1 hypothetical protein [Pseudomonas gingeri]NWA99641.1 hypothetical protein [Pseudomonas gingeri]NWB06149.1 hypothetical protein [Pseudomonas gingeri]